MTEAQQLADWLYATYEAALQVPHVNWLFRPHPTEEVYGAPYMADMLPHDLPPHIRIAGAELNGFEIFNSISGVITIAGTVGVEYAAMGKPVMVAERGWYHQAGFTANARSRSHYLHLLKSSWWERSSAQLEAAARQAQIFAGAYFGRPNWHGKYVFGEDYLQQQLWKHISALIREEKTAIKSEVECMRKWWDSPIKHYHLFNMLSSSAYEFPAQ